MKVTEANASNRLDLLQPEEAQKYSNTLVS